MFLYSKVQKSLWSLHEGGEASEVTEGKKLSAWTLYAPLKGQCWSRKSSTLSQDHRVSIIFLLQFNMPAFENFGPQKTFSWTNLPLVTSSPVCVTDYKCGRCGSGNTIWRLEESWHISSLSLRLLAACLHIYNSKFWSSYGMDMKGDCSPMNFMLCCCHMGGWWHQIFGLELSMPHIYAFRNLSQTRMLKSFMNF